MARVKLEARFVAGSLRPGRAAGRSGHPRGPAAPSTLPSAAPTFSRRAARPARGVRARLTCGSGLSAGRPAPARRPASACRLVGRAAAAWAVGRAAGCR